MTFKMFLPGSSEEAISPTVAAQRPEKQSLLLSGTRKMAFSDTRPLVLMEGKCVNQTVPAGGFKHGWNHVEPALVLHSLENQPINFIY